MYQVPMLGSFILKADIEGQLSCSVSARDGLSVKDVLWEKLENTGGRRWENFLVYTKWTRVHVEWEMNVSCVRGHALQIVNRLDALPVPLPGAHHFMRKDVINAAAAPYSEKDFYYIIRPSGSAKNTGSFALVITTPSFPNGRSMLRHVTIGFDKDTNKFLLCSKEFDNLDNLVAFFKTTPIKAHNGPNMYLRYPVPVDPQLDEECKRPWRTTRTGKQLDQDVDTISLWSCSSSLTVNSSFNTPMSYDYDGSVSGLSEDDSHYDHPRAGDKSRKPTTMRYCSREEAAMSPMSDGSHGHIYSSDVEMRAQSGSSSGGSFSSTSKHHFNNTPKSRRSQFFLPTSRSISDRSESSDQLKEPEETYVEMVPSVQSQGSRIPSPAPLPIDTLKRHPMYHNQAGSDSESPRTLTRNEEPDQCYMNVTLPSNNTTLPSNNNTLPSNSVTFRSNNSTLPSNPATLADSSSSTQEDPNETYVEMSKLRAPVIQHCSQNHEYVNRPVNGVGTQPGGPPVYQNLDPITTQKLIDNVQHLMATVTEQAKEILSLKMTVKDLKLKVDAWERLNAEEFEYAG